MKTLLWIGVGCWVAWGCGAPVSQAAAPRVTRVEPPSWWRGHTWNPVRLLISGSGLAGTTVEAPQGYRVSDVRSDESGTYLFASVQIPPDAEAGAGALRVVGAAGTAEVPFEVLSPRSRAGRFGGFSSDDVVYLIMPDRFANGDEANDDPAASRGLWDRSKPRRYHGGDLQGVIDRLPYLRDLGVTALWLTPWYDNVNELNRKETYTAENERSPRGEPVTDYHGYGAVDFYAVEERLGDLGVLQALVEEAHGWGMKVVQDQVANHTGPYHRWTTNPPTPTWFHGTVADHLENTWQTWTITEPNPPPDKLKSTLEGWFINLLPDLNQNDPETAAYLIQNSLWWIGQTGLDAVRQDTLPYVPRTYWARWTTALKREYPDLTILGEMWDGNPRLVSFFQGGQPRFDGVDSGIDTLFDFPLFYAVRDVFAKGQSMKRLAETLAADSLYVDPGVLVTFLGLHDTARFLNEPGADVEGLMLAFTFLATTRGTPLIYYGDEIAMRGGGDPDNRRDFPGGWKDDVRDAFAAAGRTAEEEAVHGHVARVLRLRKDLAPLRRGDFRELLLTEGTYAFARVAGGAGVVVAFNNARQAQRLEVPLGQVPGLRGRLLSDRLGRLGSQRSNGDRLELTLPARTAAILAP